MAQNDQGVRDRSWSQPGNHGQLSGQGQACQLQTPGEGLPLGVLPVSLPGTAAAMWTSRRTAEVSGGDGKRSHLTGCGVQECPKPGPCAVPTHRSHEADACSVRSRVLPVHPARPQVPVSHWPSGDRHQVRPVLGPAPVHRPQPPPPSSPACPAPPAACVLSVGWVAINTRVK